MELKGLKINFLGDSITEGVGVASSDATYHQILKKECNLAEVRNYGMSGTRIAVQSGEPISEEYVNVDVNSFCERFADMDDDADVVVVYGGTNDYGHGNAPIGIFSDRTPETFYGACHYLFEGLIRKYLGKHIVVLTPLHRTDEETTEFPKLGERLNLKGYVTILKEVAQYYSLPVLDLYSASGIQPAIKEIQDMYVPDGLHPNNNGHLIIANKLKMFLKSL